MTHGGVFRSATTYPVPAVYPLSPAFFFSTAGLIQCSLVEPSGALPDTARAARGAVCHRESATPAHSSEVGLCTALAVR